MDYPIEFVFTTKRHSVNSQKKHPDVVWGEILLPETRDSQLHVSYPNLILLPVCADL